MMSRDLGGRHAVHLKEIDEEDAVLVDGLGAMRGDAPVRGELGLFAIQLVEAEGRIGVADVESKQHFFVELLISARLQLLSRRLAYELLVGTRND